MYIIFEENIQNNFPLKLEFSVFYVHAAHLDVNEINYCFSLNSTVFTSSFVPALNTCRSGRQQSDIKIVHISRLGSAQHG